MKSDSDVMLDNSLCIKLVQLAEVIQCGVVVCWVVGSLTGGPLGPGSPVFPLRPWERHKAKGKKREGETTGVSGHTFCQSLRPAFPVTLSNLLLINNKKTA